MTELMLSLCCIAGERGVNVLSGIITIYKMIS